MSGNLLGHLDFQTSDKVTLMIHSKEVPKVALYMYLNAESEKMKNFQWLENFEQEIFWAIYNYT